MSLFLEAAREYVRKLPMVK